MEIDLKRQLYSSEHLLCAGNATVVWTDRVGEDVR